MRTDRPTRQVLALLLATALLVVLLVALPLERVDNWAIDLSCYRAAALALRNGANPYLYALFSIDPSNNRSINHRP